MKTAIRISMISAMLLMLAGFSVNAQYGKGHKHRSGHGYNDPDSCRIQLRVDDMREPLSLTDKQVAAIEQIHYDHMQEAKDLRKKYEGDCVGERNARRAMRDEIHDEINAVLEENQQEKFDEIIAERKGGHGPHRGPGK